MRAPFAKLLAGTGHPWLDQALHSVLGVAAPEEIVKVLVIVAVSYVRRRTYADPMDTVVYGAAAGLGFAAYENLAYLVQHPEIWRALAALRSVLTVPFHGALGIIAGAYLAIARAGTALGAHRHHRDWARISSYFLVLAGPIALHAAFDFPLLLLAKGRPRSDHAHDAGGDQRADRLRSRLRLPCDWCCGSAVITPRAPRSRANASASCGGCGRCWCSAAAPDLRG